MAGGKSSYLCNTFLNLIFNGTAYTAPATLYCALFTVAPTDTAAGTEVTTGTGYARQPIAPSTSNFSTASAQTLSNSVAIVFPTATGSWGTVVAAAFFDASTAGHMLYWGPLGSSVTVNSGNTFEFLANGFTASEA